MSVLFAYMSMYHAYAPCRDHKKVSDPPGIRVTDVCEMWELEIEPQVL